MANERTLFERILDPDPKRPRSARERKDLLIQSVIGHLARLLNSREGCAATLSDYGMPDLERYGGRIELQQSMESAIRTTILKYEPRLKRVSVKLDDRDEDRLVPRFTIFAELAPRDDYAKDVTFTTVIDPTGKIKID